MEIIVHNSCITITNYVLGSYPIIESYFMVTKIITSEYSERIMVAAYHDPENNILYLPRGIDIWWLEGVLNTKAKVLVDSYDEFDVYDDIKIKYLPKNNVQIQALHFMLGQAEYRDTITKSQLQLNLNTGAGKTYVAIGTIAYTGIKSIIITYSTNILSQWKNRILEYTNIKNKEICDVAGSSVIYRLLTRPKRELESIKVFLVTHSTLKSYADTNGWDKLAEFFKYIRVGYKFYDEAHTNFSTMCMIDYYSNVYKSFYLTATPNR